MVTANVFFLSYLQLSAALSEGLIRIVRAVLFPVTKTLHQSMLTIIVLLHFVLFNTFSKFTRKSKKCYKLHCFSGHFLLLFFDGVLHLAHCVAFLDLAAQYERAFKTVQKNSIKLFCSISIEERRSKRRWSET